MSNKEETEDQKVFGINKWVYCNQHMRPHLTGWCTVGVRNKILLNVSTAEEAMEKCKELKLPVY